MDLAINLLVSLLVFLTGFLAGKWRQRALLSGRNVEQYDFYPFAVDRDGFPAFSLPLFQKAVRHLLRHRDATAAAQLIVIAEQNGVRYQLDPGSLSEYEQLYARDHGQRVMQDSSEFLERYCAVDMKLDENILSRPEFERALAGKRHWRDQSVRLDAPQASAPE